MSITERYQGQILGVLSFFDRVIISGSLPDICHARAATLWLHQHQIKIFDFPRFAQQLRDAIRDNAERLAQEAGLTIEYLKNARTVRKEKRIQEVLAERGTAPGLVHVFSVLENCPSYQPWHDKSKQTTFLRPDSGKCLHYYFYFIDAELGLCYLRVPTYAPFRLQFYFNGHSWLAAALERAGIGFRLLDNAFLSIDDFARAQHIADRFSVPRLHRRLEQLAYRYCPVVREFLNGVHWSLMQVEYATDIAFRQRADLQPLYAMLVRTAVHAVKADQVATFLGRPLDPRYQGELGSDFSTRIQGTRIKHTMGRAALKMYDKFGRVLRLETVANDVSFFKVRREVEHRDGSSQMKTAPVRKTIYSLPVLSKLLHAANQRYLEFLSTLDDSSSGTRRLDRITRTVRKGKRNYRGFNVLQDDDRALFETLARGEFNIHGFTNRDLRQHLSTCAAGLGRKLKRLRMHGLIKKIGSTYKYYLTPLGRQAVTAALMIRALVLLAAMANL
ncbi:MAG: MarR family transcriptional regulator [Gammaproteobacteria bacterium]